MTRRHALTLALLGVPSLHCAAEQTVPLMLATNYSQGRDVSGLWYSEKFDGIRAFWDGQQMLSRSGLPLAIPDSLLAELPKQQLDGELWLGRGQFESLLGLVKRGQPADPDWQTLRFMVFDRPDFPGDYQLRYQQLPALLADVSWAEVVQYQAVADSDYLRKQLMSVEQQGGEGLIIRDPQSLYIPGRSQGFIKYKTYQDGEAKVVGYSPGKGKYQGMLGALIVEAADGRRFKLGSGFSDEQRRNPPELGSWVEYHYNGLTGNDTPRFARFVRDLSELSTR